MTALSATQLSQLLNCEQRWYLSRVQRLRPRVRSVALDMGAAFAKATEVADPAVGYDMYMEAWAAANDAARDDPWTTAPTEEQALVNATIVQSAARAYLKLYGPVERREVEYRVPIAGCPGYALVCRIDGVDDDGATLIEDKLVSHIDRGNMEQRLRIDRQVSIEFWAHWQAAGRIADQMRYRMTLKCRLRCGKNETHDEFLARIARDYDDRPEHYLAEFRATRSRAALDEMSRNLHAWAWRAYHLREGNRMATPNTDRCGDYGGCEFLPLCAGEPGAINRFEVPEGEG